MQKRTVVNSPRLLELKKGRRLASFLKFFLFLFTFVLICVGLVYLSRAPFLNIHEIEVIGNKVADTDLIKAAAQNELSGYYLWVFPKTNILLYPKKTIKISLENNFTRLQNIDLAIGKNRSLEINVTERKGIYTWCNEKECYFMDDTGYIFDNAPYFSGNVYFKFYGSRDTESDNPLGSYFMKDSFSKLILFKKVIENAGFKPISLVKENNADTKFILGGPEIIFSADSDPEIVAENLETALGTEPLKTDIKKKFSSLLYIDLRYGNKVYYKFR